MTPPPIGFVLAKTVSGLFEPTSVLLLSGVAGIVALVAGARLGRRWLGRLGLALVAWPVAFDLVLSVVPVDAWIAAPLEDRFPPLRAVPPGVVGLITIGGAVDPAMTGARGIPSLDDAAERMTEFVRLALLHPDWRLAFSGGSGQVVPGALSEADVARRLWDGLGLRGRPIVYEDRSRTTWENAVFLARLVHPSPRQLWVLDTSALQMPRAMGVFRRAGWNVVADPVGYKTAPSLGFAQGGSLNARLLLLDEAIHEWGGLLVYRLEGRTARLFPAPRPSFTPAGASR